MSEDNVEALDWGRVLSSKDMVAKLPHICDKCQQVIEKGTIYHRVVILEYSYRYHGTIKMYKQHEVCFHG